MAAADLTAGAFATGVFAAGLAAAGFGATGFAAAGFAGVFVAGALVAGFEAALAEVGADFDGLASGLAAFDAGFVADLAALPFAGALAADFDGAAFPAGFFRAAGFVVADFAGEDLADADFPADFAGFAADLDDDLSFLSDFFDFSDEAAFAEPALAVFNLSFSDFDLVLEAFFLSGLAI